MEYETEGRESGRYCGWRNERRVELMGLAGVNFFLSHLEGVNAKKSELNTC